MFPNFHRPKVLWSHMNDSSSARLALSWAALSSFSSDFLKKWIMLLFQEISVSLSHEVLQWCVSQPGNFWFSFFMSFYSVNMILKKNMFCLSCFNTSPYLILRVSKRAFETNIELISFSPVITSPSSSFLNCLLQDYEFYIVGWLFLYLAMSCSYCWLFQTFMPRVRGGDMA